MSTAVTLELVEFTGKEGFDVTGSPAFSTLRRAAAKGGVEEQYYGEIVQKPNTFVWVLLFPDHIKPKAFKAPEGYGDFRESIKALDADANPRSMYFTFKDAASPRTSLVAPVTELAAFRLKSTTVIDDLRVSLHKAFTDCYGAPGFLGGDWNFEDTDDRDVWYFLGWETAEHHVAYTKTELFAVEIRKILPHRESGFALYVKFTKEGGAA